MSIMVPTYQVLEGQESLVKELDTILKTYQQIEERTSTEKTANVTNEFYRIYLENPSETTKYILEATKVVSHNSLFIYETKRVIDTAIERHHLPDAYYCKGELYRCKILRDDVWLSYSTPLFQKAATLGHIKGMKRYEENKRAIEAYNCLQKPFGHKASPMYHREGLNIYSELVKAGRYEFATPMLNVFESTRDEKNIHRLLKYLAEKMPNNPKIVFMYKEHKKDMVWYYIKKIFSIILLFGYIYHISDWILGELYFEYHMPQHIIASNLFLYLAPAIYTYRNPRKVFSILISLLEPTSRSKENWDCLTDCMLISMLF